MLTLLLALSVSQAPLAQDFTPPPMTSAERGSPVRTVVPPALA